MCLGCIGVIFIFVCSFLLVENVDRVGVGSGCFFVFLAFLRDFAARGNASSVLLFI